LKPSEEEVINKIKEPPNTGFEAWHGALR
jgi:hypothetical protein